jgi:hypothetical protein
MIASVDRLTPFFVLFCSMYAVMPQDLKAGFRFFDIKKLRGIEAPQLDTVSSLNSRTG